jgi:hypothetical protein
MQRTLQCLVLAFTAVAWTGNLGAAEYQAVPTQKLRPREGIGHVMAKDERENGSGLFSRRAPRKES